MADGVFAPLERIVERAALERPARRRRMLVIVNPCATKVDPRMRNLVIAALQSRYDVEAVDTEARDHATHLCNEARHEGYDVVVAFGGDGTVNEIANGLAGSSTPMTCLPAGATSVLCKMLGIPGDIVDATEHLLAMADDWRPRRIDLGTVNGRAFTFASGFGIDASIVRRIDRHPRLKHHRMREHYFVYAAIETVLREYVLNPPRMEVHVGDEPPDRAISAIVQNGDDFTYLGDRPLAFAPGAALDSGTLAGLALRGARPRDVVPVTLRVLSKRRSLVGHPQINAFRDVEGLRCVSIDGRGIPLQVDGDHIGDVSEAVYGILPGALGVVS
jgi:diacylglycerol kinase family enzyme